MAKLFRRSFKLFIRQLLKLHLCFPPASEALKTQPCQVCDFSVTSLVKKFFSSPSLCIGISEGEQRAHESLILSKGAWNLFDVHHISSFNCLPERRHSASIIDAWEHDHWWGKWEKCIFHFTIPSADGKSFRKYAEPTAMETDAGEFPTKSTASDKCCAGVEVV